ncbi:MAG: succinylglutamic semialdehyde dehydrogenase [Thermoproteota archaeon]|jgi:succinylglutamic semialdehyde dehydrogenase
MLEITLLGDYFNDEFHLPKNSDESIKKLSPANLEHHLWTAEIDYTHITPTINSALSGFETWRKTPLSKRISILEKYRDMVSGRKEEIAKAIAYETGKPLWESLTEAGALAAKVNVTINDSLKRIETQTIERILPNINGHTIRKPIGPCVIIGPFNFPCHLANGQILSALISGNSIIFKPSEKTIYSSQIMFECLVQAGFPSGVINFINGSAKTAGELVKHPRIRGVFFTGSRAVGLKILESTYKDLNKLVALELGGKNATIIHHDADIDHALPEVLRACFLSSGQRCTSTSTIIIHDKIKDEFINKFKSYTEKIIIDHPVEFKNEPFMGPIIDGAAVKFYNEYCNNAVAEGAQEILPLRDLDINFKGHYVSPTIHYIDSISEKTEFTKTEIFGPNVCFTPYTEIERAIELSNISEYGLAGSIFTKQKDIYELCLRDMDVGIFNLNRSTVGASSRLAFGGVKNSGNYKPAAVSMIDHCVSTLASLETMDNSSKMADVKGLR